MANIKSSQKRILVNAKKRAANKSVKTAVKTELKKADAAIAAGSATMDASVSAAFEKVDKAAAKGLLHKNTAARRKSALAKKANAAKANA